MARCRVCHRPLTNEAHVAAGVGPICAQRAARYGVGTGAQVVQAEKLARVERVERRLAQLWQWTSDQEFNRALAAERGTPAELAHFTARVRFGWRWYERWSEVKRRMTAKAARAA